MFALSTKSVNVAGLKVASVSSVRSRRSVMSVRASTEPTNESAAEAPVVATPAVESTPIVSEPVSVPPPAPKALGFGDVMAFSGPGPELINARLSMLGFVAAVGAELSSGESVLKQVGDAPLAIAATFLLFTAATLVPIFKNAKPEAFGPFTPVAEMTNGRAAMLGIFSLLLVEGARHAALF